MSNELITPEDNKKLLGDRIIADIVAVVGEEGVKRVLFDLIYRAIDEHEEKEPTPT